MLRGCVGDAVHLNNVSVAATTFSIAWGGGGGVRTRRNDRDTGEKKGKWWQTKGLTHNAQTFLDLDNLSIQGEKQDEVEME